MDRVEIRASGSLGALASLGCYDEDTTSSESSSDSEDEPIVVQREAKKSEAVVGRILHRLIENVTRDGDESAEDADEEENLSSEDEGLTYPPSKDNKIKVRGELSTCDLPPIEDLFISVPQEQTALVGKVFSIVDSLVVVQSLKGLPAIDLDSVLFLDRGSTALGSVFDVIGPIHNPFYVIRFNSSQHVKSKSLEVGKDVFYAPRVDDLTSYVFLAQLRALRGSDASWVDDVETPLEFLDFSDDEQEREAKKALKNRKRVYNEPNPDQVANNPFYRRSRAYDPRANGPFTWNSTPAGGGGVSAPLPGTSQQSDAPIWNNQAAQGYWGQRRRPT